MTPKEAVAIKKRFKGYDWVGRLHMIEITDGNVSCVDLNTRPQSVKAFLEVVEEFDILSKTSPTFDILSKYAKCCDNLAQRKEKEKFIKEKEKDIFNNNILNLNLKQGTESEYGEDEYSKQLDWHAQCVMEFLNKKTGSCFEFYRGKKRTGAAEDIRNFILMLVKRGIPVKRWKLDEKKAVHLMQHIIKVKYMKNFPAMNPTALFGRKEKADIYISEAVSSGWNPGLCERDNPENRKAQQEIPD